MLQICFFIFDALFNISTLEMNLVIDNYWSKYKGVSDFLRFRMTFDVCEWGH
jgi:hypothetical protein